MPCELDNSISHKPVHLEPVAEVERIAVKSKRPRLEADPHKHVAENY